jgi:hypothetical protein
VNHVLKYLLNNIPIDEYNLKIQWMNIDFHILLLLLDFCLQQYDVTISYRFVRLLWLGTPMAEIQEMQH